MADSDYSTDWAIMQLGGVDKETGEVLGVPRSLGGSPVREGDPQRRGDEGLSKAHICTRNGSVTYWLGGSLMRCKKIEFVGGKERRRKGGGKRGKITGWSRASRRRMYYTIGRIRRSALPIMITLTYPAEFPARSGEWKDNLRRFWQRLKRRFPRAGMVWKLEPQKRGAPHYHLLVWGVPWGLYEFRKWVSQAWYEVVGSGDVRHLIAGTRVEQVRSRRGVMCYAGKYIGKVTDGDCGWDEPGRYWGVKGAECIPWADVYNVTLEYRQAVRLLRLMRRYMRCRRGGLLTLTMLCNSPEYWATRLREMI